MGYLRTMGPGGAGYTTKVYGNANINGNQGGGNKKQGLPPSMGISRPYGIYKTRAGGNLPNRNIVYYGNQVGNIGSNKSSQFAPGAGSSPRPSATLYGKKIISVSPPPPSISPDVPGSGSVVIDTDDLPDTGPFGGVSLDDYIEISPETKHPELITGVFGGGYLRLSKGDSDSAKYGEEPVTSDTDTPREYTLDIARTIENLVSRNMKVIVIDVDIFPGTFTDYKSGIHWNRLIDLARYVRDHPDYGINIWVALKSRSLLEDGETNRWAISRGTAAPNATAQWIQALDEIGNVKHCVGDYVDLLSSSHGTLDSIKGVVWDDFSVDYAKWNIHTESKYHTRAQIGAMYEKAVERDLKIGGVWYFDKFARAYAKDGIELGLSGPCPGKGSSTAGRMPPEGLSASYYINTDRLRLLGDKRDLRFKYFYKAGGLVGSSPTVPVLQMRCLFNDKEVIKELLDFSGTCSGGRSSEVPLIFPNTHTLGECNHVCDVATVSVPKHYIDDDFVDEVFQKLTFILEPNEELVADGTYSVTGPIFNGDTVLSVWDIEIYGSDTSLGKIEFDDVIEIHPSAPSPVTAVETPFPTRLQFSKKPTLDNAFVLGRTEEYNISEYLTPFIGFPKWCRYLYDYNLNVINKSIAKNCDLDYYAWVRTRSYSYAYDAEKLKLQFDSAMNYGAAKALLSYNDSMFVTDIDTTTDLTTYRGIFSEKDSRKDRFNKVLWWTPYHGAFEGFFKQFTTQEEYAVGTEFRMNLLFEGNLVTWDDNAFDFKITDQYDDGFELSYKIDEGPIDEDEDDETDDKEEKFMDGIIQSSWPVGSARSPHGVEWGHPHWLTSDEASTDESWRNSALCFRVDGFSKKVKLRLEIRDEGQFIGAGATFGVWFSLQKKDPPPEEEDLDPATEEDLDPAWENVTDFDFEAGYDPSYKGIYEEVSDHLKTLIS